MPFFKSNTAPTHEERLNALAATKEAALSVFAVAEADLVEVKAQAEEVFSDLDFQIAKLGQLQDAAAQTSAEAGAKASKIRSQFLGE